ncbi:MULTISPECIES: hypothetical protein [Acinetobacter]|jgi:small-conductance mechanosensitive channel|uniref:hypothetical protein n=1 Tax=Acinetobacter TaxID=469 RepID=UPI00124FE8D0|nr:MULTISPECIES: hypothetical protein [Acinetobacter]MDR0235777.1 hypothetical protein [Acinetobacter sp.]
MAQNNEITNNFKMVHQLALSEYQDELSKHRHIDEKVGRHFTILNLIIVAITACITHKELRDYIMTLNLGLKVMILIGIILLFASLAWGWYWLYKATKSTTIEKVALGKDIEDPLFNLVDEIHMNWLLYQTYKTALISNIQKNNDKSKYAEFGLIGLTCSVCIIGIYILVILGVIMIQLLTGSNG